MNRESRIRPVCDQHAGGFMVNVFMSNMRFYFSIRAELASALTAGVCNVSSTEGVTTTQQ